MSEVGVSVVMAVYNAEKYIFEAIESVLQQNYEDFEFIIVNDGSTDSSIDIINSFPDPRIILINQKNMGVSKASNVGVRAAKGKIIARIDSDDICYPSRLEKQYDFLKHNKEYVAVGSNAEIIDKDGAFVYITNMPISDEKLKEKLPISPFINSSAMYRKDAFYKIGQYCDDMTRGGDRVFFNRMAKYGKFYNFKEPLIKYRIVPNSISVRSNVGNRLTSIVNNAIINNRITSEENRILKSIGKNIKPKKRFANYHLHLAKKYLWNNYQPDKSRKNAILSMRYNLAFNALAIYFIAFVPKVIINRIYNIYKVFKKN